ncbi:MAG TPA: hypothetical protein VEQ65_08390, partial [Opitutus sp.]|nr:hypothetical protein [Opitutus sp.]
SAGLPKNDPRSAGLARAWAEIQAPAPSGALFRRVRPGYGVLMGHPDGPPPVDFNVQSEVRVPAEAARHCPAKGWLGAGFLLEFISTPTN